jgi:hypothetical protein
MAIQDLQRDKLQTALSMRTQDLMAIANGAQPKYGVDSLTAVMALQIKGPAEKAARAQQAAQQPKPPTVKDQVVAQASDMGGGITNLPAENVMTEQAMAAGGIVAFQSGGEIEDLTKELAELERQKREQRSSVGTFRTPAPYATQVATQAAVLDAKIADIRRRLQLAQNRSSFIAERNAMREQGITPAEFGTPPDVLQAQQAQQGQQPQQGQQGQQGQQAPGGLPSAKLPAYPSFAPQFAKLASDYETAAGQLETPAAAANRVLTSPDYAKLLGPSSADVTAAFNPLESTIRGTFPQSEAEALAKIQQREAGLGALREEQRTQLEASKQEAEKSANVGKGEALLTLAGTLVSTPLSSPRFQEGIGNFTGMLRTVRKDLDSARKEYRTGIAKIAEATELQKIGQGERAEARFMEGQKMLADVQGKVVTAQLASQSSQAQAAISLGGAEAQREAAKLDKKTQLTLSGIASDQQRAEAVFKGGVDLQQYQLLAGSRLGAAGNRFTYEEARTKARTELPFDAFQTEWVKSGESKRTGRAMPTLDDYDRALDGLARSILARNEAYYSGTTAAPSGGGAALDPNQFTVREKK